MGGEKESKLTDVIKKVVSVGVGAAFMTEESVKNILSDLPLPKDIISGLIQNAKGVKEDFVKGVQAELKEHLSKVNVTKLVDEVVEKYDFDVHATISFKKKKGKGAKKSDD